MRSPAFLKHLCTGRDRSNCHSARSPHTGSQLRPHRLPQVHQTLGDLHPDGLRSQLKGKGPLELLGQQQEAILREEKEERRLQSPAAETAVGHIEAEAPAGHERGDAPAKWAADQPHQSLPAAFSHGYLGAENHAVCHLQAPELPAVSQA